MLRYATREAQNQILRLHKGLETGDGKQATENTDGKHEARSAEENFEIYRDQGNQEGLPGGRLVTIERAA